MDVGVWLLGCGALPESISWVVPRDSWLINRKCTQASAEFFNDVIGGQADQMEALASAQTVDDLFARLEACGYALRIDPAHTPRMFHFATVAEAEVLLLRRIKNVIRMGRVVALEPGAMELEQGRVPVEPGTLFIDCTASAVGIRPTQPVFQAGKLVLQFLRLPQPVFSAALAAYVEAHYASDEQKNKLCAAVPFPYAMADFPRCTLLGMVNQLHWAQDKALRQWIRSCRMDGFGKLMADFDPADAEKQAIMARYKASAQAAMASMPRWMAAAPNPNH
jgi:hypothetical protein